MLYVVGPSRELKASDKNITNVCYRDYVTPLWEYSIASNLYNKATGNFGVVSWRFEQKTNWKVEDFYNFAHNVVKNGADAVICNPYPLNSALFENAYQQAEIAGHSRFQEAAVILGHLRLHDEFRQIEEALFCNYIYATKEFWQKYFLYIDSFLLATSKQDSLKKIFALPSNYSKNQECPSIVFFIERLLGNFCTSMGNQFNIIQCSDEVFIKRKYGEYARIVSDLILSRQQVNESDPGTILKWFNLRKEILSTVDIGQLEEPRRA